MRALGSPARVSWLGLMATTALVTLLAVSVSALSHEPARRHLDAGGYALLLAGSLAVAGSRRWPIPAFLLSLGSIGAYQALGYTTASPFFLGPLFTAYAAAAPGHRLRTALLALLAFPVSAAGALALAEPPLAYGVPVLTTIAFAAGQIAGELRAASARREEQARQEHELRLLSEERLRIARELHDVVSHSIAMIGVRAGVATHLLDRDPEQAREALTAIRAASKEAMRDLRGILGVLRQLDEQESRSPTPGLERLTELIESLRNAGTKVELDMHGPPRHLSPATEMAAYRIVQEALTNVVRHAPGAIARVCIRYTADQIDIEVVDDGRAPGGGNAERPQGAGQGLAGMRERAVAAGGNLQAGPRPEGGFIVHARLPAPEAA